MTVIDEQLSVDNDIVIRCGGGFGEFSKPKQMPVSVSKDEWGNSEATCPSGPSPRSTTSNWGVDKVPEANRARSFA